MRLTTTVSLLALAGLMGCSTVGSDMRIEPVMRIGPTPVLKPQLSVSESMYAMARLAHDQGQLATAAQRYRRALEMKPDHVGALNGLGVILAQDGRTAEALELLVRARDLAPGAGHIHNNLGYILLRENRFDEAQVALRMARELLPESQQTLRNLALLEKARNEGASQPTQGVVTQVQGQTQQQLQTQDTAGGAVVADSAQIVSVAPQVFELRPAGSERGVASAVAPVAALIQAPAVAVVAAPLPVQPPEPTGVAPTAQIVPGLEPSVMVLQVVDNAMPPSPDTPVSVVAAPGAVREVAKVEPLPTPDTGYRLVLSRELALQQGPFAIWTDIRGVKLEIANGAGVVRLARRTADRLAQEGVVTARLTNARPYRQRHTQIEYAPGQEAAVQALAARLPLPVDLVPVSRLDREMTLRLVLGQDALGRTIAAWLDGNAPQLAQQTAITGPAG
ncbi:LytR C-terminal domain-containing protein [Hydrogenophaga sp.]|uniref:LytR C-terminal domain-containing protein n=1 Tax=Hydrogenophaga sp. TaxID=1904254 RepID=UPI002726F1E6|nr:LytR C-terminal domain-containing protein [Hydrogenophaga sp.]MDO8905344.1 tetratricopeptide repeat protein [Hydrogenophaga sp.]